MIRDCFEENTLHLWQGRKEQLQARNDYIKDEPASAISIPNSALTNSMLTSSNLLAHEEAKEHCGERQK